MASKETEHMSTCLVCFETRPLKIVGNCKHSFCTECLSAVLGSLDSGSEVFACPSCKVDCPRPSDGVKGLVDFNGEDVSDVTQTVTKDQSEVESLDIKCQICQHRKKEVQAVNLCVECGHLHICQDCTKVHAKNKATQKHVVVPLKRQEAQCELHNSALNSYCIECEKAVCMICVMIEHGDHTVERLGDTIRTKVDELKDAFEQELKKLIELQNLKKEWTLFKLMIPVVDTQDTLITEIEEHAQKSIDQIVKWKEDLKTQVNDNFKILKEIPVGLELLADVVAKLESPINNAATLLRETEHHPIYLKQLITLKQDLAATTKLGDDMKGREFRDELNKLHLNCYSFLPDVIPTSFGKIGTATTYVNQASFNPKEIFKQTVYGLFTDPIIPCVANLGKQFAVAHPKSEGKYSNTIDIYEFPGRLINTLRNHVPPIYDMSATPDGKLAVLSDGTVDSSCSVQVFEPETGFISSTCDVDVARPKSIGVTLQNQFVILGDNEQGQTQITVADKDGRVQHRLVLNQGSEKVKNPKRITCGGRFIFVQGNSHVAVFEIKDTMLQAIKSGIINTFGYSKDISATVWDDFFVTGKYKDSSLDLDSYPYKENTQKWYFHGNKPIHENVTRADMEGRVSTRDGHIVVSYGRTVRVYKL